MMKKKKKKLDDIFDDSHFSGSEVSSLFFREDAIKRHESESASIGKDSGVADRSDITESEAKDQSVSIDTISSIKPKRKKRIKLMPDDVDESELSEIFGQDEPVLGGISSDDCEQEVSEKACEGDLSSDEKVTEDDIEVQEGSESGSGDVGEGEGEAESGDVGEVEAEVETENCDAVENEIEAEDGGEVICDIEGEGKDDDEETSDEEMIIEEPTEEAEPQEELSEGEKLEESFDIGEGGAVFEEEASDGEVLSKEGSEVKDPENIDMDDIDDPDELAMMIAKAILSDDGEDQNQESDDSPSGGTDVGDDIKASEGNAMSNAESSTAAIEEALDLKDTEKSEKVKKARNIRQKRASKGVAAIKNDGGEGSRKKLSSDKKVFVMGDPNIPIDSNLPHRFFRRIAGRRRSMIFVCVCYTLFLSLLVVMLSVGTSKLLAIYDSADPDRVIEECIDYISGSRLYNDVVLGVGKYRTEYESEKDASGKALDKIYSSSDKNYMRVSHGEDYASYDIYSDDVKIYNVLLGKKAETSSMIGISFWEVREISFYDDCLDEYKKSFLISAPADAVVCLNGIELSREMIIDENYKFFIGSVWESEIPSEARCVLYSVSGIFGDPTFTATHGSEELEIYTDDGGTVHAKYPKDWVKDYTVFVPKGASLYVNGILATKIDSVGNAPATPFESEVEGMTDVYVIEGLFNDPILNAYYDGISLGESIRSGDDFSFAFSDVIYNKAEISVPKGAVVKVNGVLLTSENSTVAAIPFSEWSKEKMAIGSSMPSELRAFGFKMPEFEKYTVSMLYGTPTVEVSYDGTVYEAYATATDGKLSTFKYDKVSSSPSLILGLYIKNFAKTYVKYISEGCYGMRDDVEMRKNFYTNWINYLSYILPDTLCYDSALESYSDVEYRPNSPVASENYTIKDLIKYSDDIYTCKVVCNIKAVGSDVEETYELDLTIVVSGGQYKIWMHDTIS